jgi:hypothetical protein
MKSELLRFLKSTIVVLLGLLIIDLLTGFIGNKIIERLPNYGGATIKDNFRLNKLKTDILIIGSSRASHHYVPSYIKDNIKEKYTIYNAGHDGQFVDCNSCITECVIKREKPKLIIFEIEEFELFSNDLKYRLETFAPYYNNNSIVKNYINRLGLNERIKIKSNLYKYNSKIPNFIISLVSNVGINDGYEPLYTKMKIIKKENNNITDNNKNTIIDEYSKNNFTNVIKLCNKEHIKIIVVSSPRYKTDEKNDFLKELCNTYNVPYIDMETTNYFNNHPGLFADAAHLNNDGATIYTKMFLKKLKLYLK